MEMWSLSWKEKNTLKGFEKVNEKGRIADAVEREKDLKDIRGVTTEEPWRYLQIDEQEER